MKVPLHAMEIFLQPGELWFGDDDLRIRTILGSCVAMTLWHPERHVGGMCHYMLPMRPLVERAVFAAPDGRYGDEAIEILIREICAAGTRPDEYIVKLFGGGRMFPTADPTLSVPDKNVAAARKLVARHGLKVTAEHLGGHGHRHVMLDTWNGKTWLKHASLQSFESMAPPFLLPEAA